MNANSVVIRRTELEKGHLFLGQRLHRISSLPLIRRPDPFPGYWASSAVLECSHAAISVIIKPGASVPEFDKNVIINIISIITAGLFQS